jgi:DNA-binding NtrC family response regulator
MPVVAARVLIIEDDRDSAEFLKLLVEPRGYLVRTAATGQEARDSLTTWRPELVLMDMMLPDAQGLDLLRHFREASPETQIIMVTGYGSVPKAVEAMEAGAFSFIEKPVDVGILMAMLEKAGEKLALSAENRRLKEELREHTAFANIVARSDKMRQLFHLIRSVAPTDASVLVHGENGTGKELVATAIHQHSKRAGGPFIKINCAAIPSELIESELFGHKRGAFTGAVSDKTGLMELADGGSLLLDEIGEMPANLQVKLLRVLQDREFRPVGGSRVIKPNFRLICATNVNIDAALGDGKLREDLYFRINTVTLSISPLRDRTDDVLLLAEHFLGRFSTEHQRSIASIHPDAGRALLRYRWPGNVRELEHVIERAVIVAEGTQVTVDDLPPEVRDADRFPAQSGFVIPPHHTLEEIEKLAILETLERTRWNKRKAASILGVYRPRLKYTYDAADD